MSFHEMDIGTIYGRPFDMVGPYIPGLTPEQLRLIQDTVENGSAIEIYTGREGSDYLYAKRDLIILRRNTAAQLKVKAKFDGRLYDPVLVQVSSPDGTRSITWAGPASLVYPRESYIPAASLESQKGER